MPQLPSLFSGTATRFLLKCSQRKAGNGAFSKDEPPLARPALRGCKSPQQAAFAAGLSAEPAPAGQSEGHSPHPRGVTPTPSTKPRASQLGTWTSTLPEPRWFRRCQGLQTISRHIRLLLVLGLKRLWLREPLRWACPLPRPESEVIIQQNALTQIPHACAFLEKTS